MIIGAVALTPAELAKVRDQAEREYPAECCGMVLVHAESGERLLVPCRNVQDALHAKDPALYPRTSRTAYSVDQNQLLAILRREEEGYRIATIYHSHIDAGAYFSETDKEQALWDDQPRYPDVVYVVVSVEGGRMVDAAAFVWDPAQREFAKQAVDAASREVDTAKREVDTL
jgi:proteasome lid subunit RPN8/RPN11